MAQLSFGLSTEYSKKPAQQDAKSDKVDADRQLYAKYYVSQIMQLGEEGIRDAWSKVSCCSQSNLVGLQEHRSAAHVCHWLDVLHKRASCVVLPVMRLEVFLGHP